MLFVCSENALRSPMAEGLARMLPGTNIEFGSAGVRAGDLDPMAGVVMGELGIDITGHVSRRITDVVLTHPELVVTLSPEAQHTVIELTRVAEWDVEYWPTPDPSVAEGHREIILAAYRDLRNYLQMRIAERFAIPPGQA